jgi:pyruvate dehydrogenase E1 component alpha subunit
MIENIPINLLKRMYETMLGIRKFEERVGDLILEGKIKTPCHLYIGEEAIATGVCAALAKRDYVFSNHRGHGHYIAKGGDVKELMAEIFCKKTGCSRGKGGSMHIVAPEVGLLGTPPIVGASIAIAVGVALSANIRKEKRVAVSFFGDGATNEGIFYESLNFASLKKLPVIFVCENNLYSTHMPIAEISASTNIAKKASGFDMPGIRIDGNDVIKVYQAAKEAKERALKGKGPTLIEYLTYRWRGHVGSDDNVEGKHTDIRPGKELDSWKKKCPITKLEKILEISEEEKEKILNKIEKEVEEAVIFAEKSPKPGKEDLFKDIFQF